MRPSILLKINVHKYLVALFKGCLFQIKRFVSRLFDCLHEISLFVYLYQIFHSYWVCLSVSNLCNCFKFVYSFNRYLESFIYLSGLPWLQVYKYHERPICIKHRNYPFLFISKVRFKQFLVCFCVITRL